ncbi:MAG: hypothetical protein AB9907_12785 [Flexilinea sp.]
MSSNFNPIPAYVAPGILAAQAQPQPVSPAALQLRLETRLKELLFPEAAALEFFCCSREGLYEAVINSFAQNEILVCVNGPFSQQWFEIAKAMGIDTAILDASYGKSFNESLLEKKLSEQDYEAIFLVEIDPYTGVYVDVPALSAIIRKNHHDTLIVVDCSASITNVRPLKLGTEADIILSCSEISLGLPPGLGIIAIGEHANFKTLSSAGKGWYFNFARQHLLRDNPVRSNPPYPLLFALDKLLDEIFLEGIEEKILRTQHLSETVKNWAIEKGFQTLPEAQIAASDFTVLHCLPQFSPEDLIGYLENYGITIGNCPGEMKDTFFVIAHMNAVTENDLERLIFVLNHFLSDYDTRTNLPKTVFYDKNK